MATKKPIAAKLQAKTKSAAEELTHVLIRVRSEDGQTIQAHQDMISARGSALLGKMGAGLGASFVATLNEQVERGATTCLFLATREGWNGPYVAYRCELAGVYGDLTEEKRGLVPSYYSPAPEDIKTWFEITTLERMSRSEMNQITVISSGRTIMSVIGSSATTFRVRY